MMSILLVTTQEKYVIGKEDVKSRPFLACECKVTTHKKLFFVYFKGNSDIYLVVGY